MEPAIFEFAWACMVYVVRPAVFESRYAMWTCVWNACVHACMLYVEKSAVYVWNVCPAVYVCVYI